MTYMLIAIFFDGTPYVERRHLTLHECAGQAAMIRIQTQSFDLEQLVGRVKYVCIPEGRS
jgi:hypothetical protein